MDGRKTGNRVDVRPSRDDRCSECGDVVADAWVLYAQKPEEIRDELPSVHRRQLLRGQGQSRATLHRLGRI